MVLLYFCSIRGLDPLLAENHGFTSCFLQTIHLCLEIYFSEIFQAFVLTTKFRNRAKHIKFEDVFCIAPIKSNIGQTSINIHVCAVKTLVFGLGQAFPKIRFTSIHPPTKSSSVVNQQLSTSSFWTPV
jgi:hypothetical protein